MWKSEEVYEVRDFRYAISIQRHIYFTSLWPKPRPARASLWMPYRGMG